MAIVLSTLCSFLYDGICSKEIEQVLEALHQSLQTSLSFPAGTMLCGGAVLGLSNASARIQEGLDAEFVAPTCESELIYTARMFFVAREHGL